LGLLAAYLWGGFNALALTLMLSILEISLSFDNAIINSTILQKMQIHWQTRFLTWGIFISVFLIRILLPILMITTITHLNILEVFNLALKNPGEYSKHLLNAKISISFFGGMFLILVFLKFIFEQKRQTHWLGMIEKRFNYIGRFRFIEIVVALVLLAVFQEILPLSQRVEAIFGGLSGIMLFILLDALIINRKSKHKKVASLKNDGVANFLYLEILDASFSLDGIIGAFAITKDIVVILLGLSIGAIFVRSLTLFFVNKGSLKKYLYLEHGAHYAIGALAIIMLMNNFMHIPDILTGLIGVCFIGLSFISSIKQ